MSNPYFKNCVMCGPDNPDGFHLVNTYIDGKSHMELEAKPNMTGLSGLVHGGFTCMLLDEVMYYAVDQLGVGTVTLNMNIDFTGPVKIGSIMVGEGWIEERDGKKITIRGRVTCGDKVVAEAKGLYLEVDLEKFIGAL